MLVLTRRIGQSVLLGSEIKLTLVAVNGRNVRLAVEAPQSVRILRGELVNSDQECAKLLAAHEACGRA